jgi:DNA-3-methyladenine glycosylase II
MARSSTERLTSSEALQRQLRALLRRNPELRPIVRQAGAFEIRLTPAGFSGLARVICGQQLSVASARAIWGRFAALPGALDPVTYLTLSEEAVRATGFSAGKYRTCRVIAEAIVSGDLDLALVETMSGEDAVTYLTAHKGIGPWTAEIYLMFCTGHPDIFPVGDLALRNAVGHALGMPASPTEKDLTVLAAKWAPYRHAAALLFWKYYAAVMRKTAGTAL